MAIPNNRQNANGDAPQTKGGRAIWQVLRLELPAALLLNMLGQRTGVLMGEDFFILIFLHLIRFFQSVARGHTKMSFGQMWHIDKLF